MGVCIISDQYININVIYILQMLMLAIGFTLKEALWTDEYDIEGG